MEDRFPIASASDYELEMFARYNLPSGEYILGDPCYLFPEEVWENLLASKYSVDEGIFATVGDFPVIAFNAAYGDGMYYDQTQLVKIPVDSGLIGVFPFSLVDLLSFHYQEERLEADEWENNYFWIDSMREFEVYDDGGVLHFGEIVIDTEN